MNQDHTDNSILLKIKDRIVNTWAILPKLHRRALSILLPILVVLLLLPSNKEDAPEQASSENTPPQRVVIPLNIQTEGDEANKTQVNSNTQTVSNKPTANRKVEANASSKTKERQSVTLATNKTQNDKSAQNKQKVKTSNDKPIDNKPQLKVATNGGPQPWNNYIIKQGDTLSKVFRENNLSMSELVQLVKVEGEDKPLSHLSQGQLIRFKLTTRGDLDIIQIKKAEETIMFFRLNSGGFARSQ